MAYTVIETNEYDHWVMLVENETSNWKEIYIKACKVNAILARKTKSEVDYIEKEEKELIDHFSDIFYIAKQEFLNERGAYLEIVQGVTI